jgi:hypothetical protein
LVPGAGPAIDGSGWKVARHPKHRRRRKPYLTDNVQLGREFRKHYVRGLKRLIRRGELKFGGSVEFLNDADQRNRWLDKLEQTDWNVFVQGPPKGNSDPADVIKYLAGYLTGGPIADRRIIRADDDEVWFWARPKTGPGSTKRRGMNRPRPYRLSGRQFLQRWSLHILPKGFTRSRSYGGYHGSKREAYLKQCSELLGPAVDESTAKGTEPDEGYDAETDRKCPHCEASLRLIRSERRPSWRKIFEREIYRLEIYSPQHHLGAGRSPPQATTSA